MLIRKAEEGSVEFQKKSKYQEFLDELAALEPGKILLLDVPADLKPVVFMNRLWSAIHKSDVKPPSGYRFKKRLTLEGSVCVMLVTKGK